MSIDVISDTGPAMQSALAVAWHTLTGFRVPVSQQTDMFAYFKSLNEVLIALEASGEIKSVEVAMTHVNYLADKAGCNSGFILGGGYFTADPQVILDAVANICDALQAASEKRTDERRFDIPEVASEVTCEVTDTALQNGLALAWQTLSGFRVLVSRQIDLFAYFKSLGDVLSALNESGAIELVHSAMAHVDYLADNAGYNSAVILGGGHFAANTQVVLDALANISAALQSASQNCADEALEHIADTEPKIVSAFVDTELALQDTLALVWPTLSRFHIQIPQSTGLFAYLKCVDDVLTALKASGAGVSVEAAMSHVSYLADKAGCDPDILLKGGDFIVDPLLTMEAITNIDAVLQMVPQERVEQPPEGMPEDIFASILEAEAQLVGWCSREKALVIAQTVLQERPVICVEIGVFGGRSLVPCAAALRHIGAGTIYGIEAWSPNVAVENITNEINDEWWSKIDFASIKREFYRFVAATNLTQHMRLIEAPSGRAAALFDHIDFLHIDGSHSMINAAEDVILYARKVRSGGIIIFDDVNWQSTAPARELLGALCDTVTVLKDPESGLDICAVLRRR
jgi:predicted O-methyltransferase YrrM